jgi:general secretion pathway protein E
MGVERYLLASSLSGVLAQRLVRRLCPQCSIERVVPPAMLERLRTDAGCRPEQSVTVRQPKGCPACRQTGYAGRTAISEFMPIADDVRESILRGATEREVEEAAGRAGMVGMYRDGLARVLAGETTVEEVLQATRIR